MKTIEEKVNQQDTTATDALTVSSNGGGTVVPAGTSSVNRGVPTTITATPNPDCAFVRWTVVSGTANIADADAAETTVTLAGTDAAIMAIFSSTLTVNAGAGGTATPSGVQSGVILGVAFDISATPDAGYSFVNWTASSGTPAFGDANARGTTVTLVTGPATVQANFTS
ncbi:MAG: hypothetical protein NT090_01630, partial [Acidobacteria bacterium]|nr:hypothetical protein [Acidobacteriota bacterium]